MKKTLLVLAAVVGLGGCETPVPITKPEVTRFIVDNSSTTFNDGRLHFEYAWGNKWSTDDWAHEPFNEKDPSR